MLQRLYLTPTHLAATASILGAPSVADYLSAISGTDARLADKQDEGTGGETDEDAGNDGTDTEDLTGESLISPEGADVGLPFQRVRTAFTGFKDPKLELILLQALNAVRPFGAQYRRKLDAWRSIVQHPKDHDPIEQEAGRPAVFSLVNAREYHAKWNTLSDEYAEQLHEMRRTTGANPTLTKRLKLMGAIYDYEQSCKEESARKKQKRSHYNARTESDSSISVTSSSSVSTPRTPGLRKRTIADFANETIKTAAGAIARQTEYQQKQI
ncbi:MAG: hypothetical protein JOS17DRAFT_830500 [Linnemannia elongata]|nr:MAG: hypothetical protein JOS17DRAFT_830500 [Linnemannia elongata]